jgi:hypothetical protein
VPAPPWRRSFNANQENPMAKKNPFEKSGKDKESKKTGKEGSKKEEAFDKGQMAKPFGKKAKK